jgi:large subunit ribosomal protein L30
MSQESKTPKKSTARKATEKATKTVKVAAKEEPKKATPEPAAIPATLETPVLCVIRVRGAHGMRRTILDTLKLLNLHSVNHAIVVPADKCTFGMIQKAKDYIAYGPIDTDTLAKMLHKRGLIVGNQPLTDAHVQYVTDAKFNSIDDLAKGIVKNQVRIREIRGLKPVFRLRPPQGGYAGSIKKPLKAGGVLGNHGENINKLLRKMI